MSQQRAKPDPCERRPEIRGSSKIPKQRSYACHQKACIAPLFSSDYEIPYVRPTPGADAPATFVAVLDLADMDNMLAWADMPVLAGIGTAAWADMPVPAHMDSKLA